MSRRLRAHVRAHTQTEDLILFTLILILSLSTRGPLITKDFVDIFVVSILRVLRILRNCPVRSTVFQKVNA